MRVKNHRIADIPFRAASNIGGEITPTLVVLHDTASRLEDGNAAAYLRDNDAGVSVHFVVERDGSIEQQVPTNRQASHAGKSSYHGREWCNRFSIGIEIVNPGVMRPVPGGGARAWWGQVFLPDAKIEAASTPEHGSGMWMHYTPEQIRAVGELLECLFRDIPTLTDIRGHWYVSPRRKVDPSPLFPMERIRTLILGRADPAELEAEALSSAVSGSVGVQITTGGSALNMRRWPSFNPNVVALIPNGTVVPIIRSGEFAGRRWNYVLFDGAEGWIVDAYTKPV